MPTDLSTTYAGIPFTRRISSHALQKRWIGNFSQSISSALKKMYSAEMSK